MPVVRRLTRKRADLSSRQPSGGHSVDLDRTLKPRSLWFVASVIGSLVLAGCTTILGDGYEVAPADASARADGSDSGQPRQDSGHPDARDAGGRDASEASSADACA